jgi:succinate dehydrogenase / fumarate reductase flavoprotein subunit
LGGNSLSDLLVFGRRAGLYAADFAKKHPLPAIDDAQLQAAIHQLALPFERQTGENPFAIHADLQVMMQAKVGIVRRPDELQEAINDLKILRDRAAKCMVLGSRQFNPGWHMAIDLQSMIAVSETVARSALQRTESRGGHTREDHPGYDPVWAKQNSLVKANPDGSIDVGVVSTQQLPEDLKALFDPGEVEKYQG